MIIKRNTRGAEVKHLQVVLKALGYLNGAADGIFGGKTEDAVLHFQNDSDVLTDGKVGDVTKRLLDEAVKLASLACAPLFIEPNNIDILPPPKRLSLVSVKTDKIPGVAGYSSMRMREDIAVQFNAFVAEMHSLGAHVTSIGCVRSIQVGGGKAQSKCSNHYVARAWDLSLPSVYRNIAKVPYLLTKNKPFPNIDDKGWTVWAKCDGGELRTLEVVTARTVNVKKKKRLDFKVKTVEARVVSLTAIAAKHGFHPIGSRRSAFRGFHRVSDNHYRSRGRFTALEGWHFQNETGLIHGESVYGTELMKVYSLDQLQAKFIFWDEVKGWRWGVEWR